MALTFSMGRLTGPMLFFGFAVFITEFIKADDFPVSVYRKKSFIIPVDASSSFLKSSLEALPGVGSVEVNRQGPSATGGYTWDVSFLSTNGPSDCSHSSRCFEVTSKTNRVIQVSDVDEAGVGDYILSGYKGGRPIYRLLGTNAKVEFDQTHTKWELFSVNDVPISESYGAFVTVPFTGWTNGATINNVGAPVDLLTGTDAGVNLHLASRGTKATFDNTFQSADLSNQVSEIQKIELAASSNEIQGVFEVSFGDANQRVKINWDEEASDLVRKLESLPSIGRVDVARIANGRNGFDWLVTFLDQFDDVELLRVYTGAYLAGTDVTVRVEEMTKGSATNLTHVFAGLTPGTQYHARVVADNAAGRGKYSSEDQDIGRGFAPFALVASNAPERPVVEKVTTISDSQIEITFTKPNDNGSPIEAYRIEWTTDLDFGIQHVLKVSITNTIGNDTIGFFNLVIGANTIGKRTNTVPLPVDSSSNELSEALMTLPTVSDVSASIGTFDEFKIEWLVTFTQDIDSLAPLDDIDCSKVRSRNGLGSISCSIDPVITGSAPGNYGYELLYADSSLCNSIYMGKPSSAQYLQLFAEFDTLPVSQGSFQLSLDHETSSCISYDATSAEIKSAIVENFSAVSDVDVIAQPATSTSQFPFEYMIVFHGEYAYGNEWPILTVSTINFGQNACNPFVGGKNHRALVLPLKEKTACSDGVNEVQVIVADAESTLGGSFDLSYSGKIVKSVPISATSTQMEEFIKSVDDLLPVEVTRVSHHDKSHGVAWAITFSREQGNVEALVIADRLTTGKNAKVNVYPLLNFSTYAKINDIFGEFRIYLGGEVTRPISFRATQGKILDELQRLKCVGKAAALGNRLGQTGLDLSVLVDNSLAYAGQNALSTIGDVTTSISTGDKLSLGTCNLVVRSLEYTAFDALSGAGYIYANRYASSDEEESARAQGYTMIQVQLEINPALSFSYTSDCGVLEEVSSLVRVGSLTVSRMALSGRVSIVSDISLVSSTKGSPYVEISDGVAGSILPGSRFMIGGVEYEIDVSNDNCGSNCIKFTSTFLGSNVTDSNTDIQVYPLTGLKAYTTADLRSVLTENDIIFFNEDEFVVKSISPNVLTLDGRVSLDHIGATGFAVGNGVDYAIVMKAFTADLDTFQIIPESNWRGTGARISMKRSSGQKPMCYLLGNPSEIQTLTLRDISPGPGNHFTLTMDGYTTSSINWPTGSGADATLAIQNALMALQSVKAGVTVELSFQDLNEYVYKLIFWGVYLKQSVPELISSVTQGDADAELFVHTVRDGVANAFFSSKYIALKQEWDYRIRISARNERGYGLSSDIVTATTASTGLPPGPPTSIFMGQYLSSSDLLLTYQEPLNDGGADVTRYKIEWDSSKSFTPSSMNYGMDEASIEFEEQDIILSCQNSCYGTFTLSWGGKVTPPLSVDSSASNLEVEIAKITSLYEKGVSSIRVTKKGYGYGHKWSVTFNGIRGNLGELDVDGHFLYGGNPTISVEEVVSGCADIVPGSYTNEVQTVYIYKERGYTSPITGTFVLRFEDKDTIPIDVLASAEEMEMALESLQTIHTVNVEKRENGGGLNAWVITFTHLVEENIQGAGDTSILEVSYTSISEPAVSRVVVFENVKGTGPMVYKIRHCTPGMTYYSRVVAFNALGYGVASSVAMVTPRGQADPPPNVSASVAEDSGTSLHVEWTKVDNDGGNEVEGYKIEWFSSQNIPEIQKITTSATDGTSEIQIVRTSADLNGITGFFTLSFRDETTDMIAHNAPASGIGSVEEKLARLSSIGSIKVTRDYSKIPVKNAEFNVLHGGTLVTATGLTDLSSIFSVGDIIFVGGEQHIISSIASNSFILEDSYNGPTVSGSFGAYVYKWAYGYEWTITFLGHVGDQASLTAYPGQNWAGSNVRIDVTTKENGVTPIGGTFRLSYGGENTFPLLHNSGETVVKDALEALETIGKVDVNRFENNNGHNYFVTFLTEIGNLDIISVHDSQITGPNAKVGAATIQDGSKPLNYGVKLIDSVSMLSYTIDGLVNGKKYFVRVSSKNSEGFGGSTIAMPSPISPKEAPSAPAGVSIFPLSNSYLKVSWGVPTSDGGSSITHYKVQWDIDASFLNIDTSGFEYIMPVNNSDGPYFCYNIPVDSSSASIGRYARVAAFNGFKWSELKETSKSAVAQALPPGEVQNVHAEGVGDMGILINWSAPDASFCVYGGDGGSPITYFEIEWDKADDFSTLSSYAVSSLATSYLIGGKDTITGSVSDVLESGESYYVRVTAFNAIGAGPPTPFDKIVGPLVNRVPDAPAIRNLNPLTSTSLIIDWGIPNMDGGSSIQNYVVEYDSSPDFSSPSSITVPVVSEKQAIVVEASDIILETQTIKATVAVTNERQLVRTTVSGTDEVQMITTTCDDVVAEVQTITLNAIDNNEEQRIAVAGTDIDEIQVVRSEGMDTPEIQSVKVTVSRTNEIQQLGIVISNINTDGNNINSDACYGINVGEGCHDIEDAITGSFTVALDFDDCGGVGINFCQAAVTKFDSGLGTISCTPELVSDLSSGGDHCVSSPVQLTFGAVEGHAGTLQDALNNLVDDNNLSFMYVPSMPSRQAGVSVTRTSRIKTKGTCTNDSGGDAAVCTGEYEVFYSIEFNAPHTSGDLPAISIMHSDLKIDKSSSSYLTKLCPSSYFTNGCESPIGMAKDANFGNFYEGSYLETAYELVKGSQPSGTISLAYECESDVIALVSGHMSTFGDAIGAFSDPSYTAQMSIGHWVRFSAGSTDHYRKILSVDTMSGQVTFTENTPATGTYTDVEYGDYFSDWSGVDGDSGVSETCRSDRIHNTHPIDVTFENELTSTSDWENKIKGLLVVDSTGVSVSRDILDLSNEVGHVWSVTFSKQPGNVNTMLCNTLTGSNQCEVNIVTEGSLISGLFKLQTTWPHEYEASTPGEYETSDLRWNVAPSDLKLQLESILEQGEKVFGNVDISRSAYIPTSHNRWSGGYVWTIIFTSRGGNIPAMTTEVAGFDGILSIADEDSGPHDTYQGYPNKSVLAVDDPGTARDGNQVSGSFALSWAGNDIFYSVTTSNIFSIQTDGIGTDKFTALSASDMRDLLTEHIFSNVPDQILVTRSGPSQAMGYTYSIVFVHEDVGGDVPQFVYIPGGTLMSGTVSVAEFVTGTSILGTFQLRFNGETTGSINHDASAEDVENALNELITISPSTVTVSRTHEPIKTGPANGVGGLSTQVGGYEWSVTFASNVWKEPTDAHDSSFVPGNWVGASVDPSDTWETGFPKAWGKNVGDVPLMECVDNGLSTSNGIFPNDGCLVSEVVAGTDPLGGQFKVCLDTFANDNNVISVSANDCTDFIDHNAMASAAASNGDGSSMEEKLEALSNIGDVKVSRSDVNERNGGYTWTVTFIRDVDGPCQQKDDVNELCNSPGNVPKICDTNGSTACDVSALLGSCSRPRECVKLTVLDASDYSNNIRPAAMIEQQKLVVRDTLYAGWQDGSIVSNAATGEYKLNVNGVETVCIEHNASDEVVRDAIQAALDGGDGGVVQVLRIRSETEAPNGFLYFLKFFDTANIATVVPEYSTDSSVCSYGFVPGQVVSAVSLRDGNLHPTICDTCVDGIVQRGDLTTFEVLGDNISGSLSWNASPPMVQAHLQSLQDRHVDVSRTILDKFGTVEWVVTFTSNPGVTPAGAGDVDLLNVAQGQDTSGSTHSVFVQEIKKGSTGLSGHFTIDYDSPSGAREVSFDEPPLRLKSKLEEFSTIGNVFVIREKYPSVSEGGWGAVPVSNDGSEGGLQWTIYFLKNPGVTNGVTFPPGSGNVVTPTIDDSTLSGDNSKAEVTALVDGSPPIAGDFKLNILGEQTEPVSHIATAEAVEQSLNDLAVTGYVSTSSTLRTMQKIPGIHVNIQKDHTSATVVGGDLRQHLTSGDFFRIGGSDGSSLLGDLAGIDGGLHIGSAILSYGSPLLTESDPSNSFSKEAGEQLRINGDQYGIVSNGVEVQQIVVHRSNWIADAEFYQLQMSLDGVTETTNCLKFDASASNLEDAINSLSKVGADGVQVTKSNSSTGITGAAHFYKVYFKGLNVAGDVSQLEYKYCANGIPSGVNASNSNVSIKTIIQGGSVEHQRITLSSDSGTIEKVSSFQILISDHNSNTLSSGCLQWGVPSLGLASLAETEIREGSLSVGSNGVTHVVDNIFSIHASGFVEGVIDVGEKVNPGGDCLGKIIESATENVIILSANGSCGASPGDQFEIFPDTSITEYFSGRQVAISQIASVTLFSDRPVLSSASFYKLQMTVDGVTSSTSCLQYGVDASILQSEIDSLYDYDQNGVIDSMDSGHVRVTRHGDGSATWGYGFVYNFESKGSSTYAGASIVLGTNAPTIEVVNVGSAGGCSDANGIEDTLDSSVSTIDGNSQISFPSTISGSLHPGNRVKIDASSDPNRIYFVNNISSDGLTVTLTENFDGASLSQLATVALVIGGIPQISVEVTRHGVDEYFYDVFFIGRYWGDLSPAQVNVFGDGSCDTNSAHIIDGMSRYIGATTIIEGGEPSNVIVLDSGYHGDEQGVVDVYDVPPIFRVHDDTSEIQQMIVKDDDSAMIWGSVSPSFKLSFLGEYTGCIDYNSEEAEIENALNGLNNLCPGSDACVTVTKSIDSAVAPNGFIYNIYFNGEHVARTNIADPGISGLIVDVSHVDCVAFDNVGGETVELRSLKQGSLLEAFSSTTIPLSGLDSSNMPGTWMGKDAFGLPLYRVTGMAWVVEFDSYLGNVPPMVGDIGTLPASAASIVIHDDVVGGINPTTAFLTGLETGIPYHARVIAENIIGLSLPSQVKSGIASSTPESPDVFRAEHVVHVDEVQSVSVVATHVDEVQRIVTSAAAIPEVQEVSLVSDHGFLIESGHFSLRYPEVQTISWTASSEVSEGSFFVKLVVPDIDASISNGNGIIVTKELKTPCIPFDATADEVKNAMEIAAIENGLGVGAIEVVRSDSTVSNFGFSYEVHFVGETVRGNIREMTSDWSLGGLDALGGSTCVAFNAPTDDEVMLISTHNENRAMGTDTPSAVITVSADNIIVEGQFELSLNYLGAVQKTACVDWNTNESTFEYILESLSNVDSVRVVRTGDGTLGSVSETIYSHSFACIDGENTVIASSSIGLSDALDIGDRVKFDGQSDTSIFYSVVAISGSTITLSKPFDGLEGSNKITVFFRYQYGIFFDGQTMHINDDENNGFKPADASNFVLTSINSCKSLKTRRNGSVREFSDIPEADASISIRTIRNGGHTLPAVASSTSSADLTNALRTSMPDLATTFITRSLEDDEFGMTYTVKFDESDGDVPNLACNLCKALSDISVSCQTATVLDGNVISGHFYVGSSDAISFDASAQDMQDALETTADIGSVKVHRSESSAQLGYAWMVTFDGKRGDVDGLVPVSSLFGKDATITAYEVVKGNGLGGTFTLSYGSETTNPLAFNCDESVMQNVLRSIESLEEVVVTTDGSFNSEGGRTYLVTFLGAGLGDTELLVPGTDELTGRGKAITVREETRGSIATGDALGISFNIPSGCSQSQVEPGTCGSAVSNVEIEIDTNVDFLSNPILIGFEPDKTVQIVKVSSSSFSIKAFQQPYVSGFFQLIYDEAKTGPIGASASSDEVRYALESLPGVATVSVSRDYSSSIFLTDCINIEYGSSRVLCSPFCLCNFGSSGMGANNLVKIGSEWFRVKSSFQGSENDFYLGTVENSLISKSYSGPTLIESSMYTWAGGYEWTITFHDFAGRIQHISSPKHNLYPREESSIEIKLPECSRCLTVESLTMWRPYYMKTRARNVNGWGSISPVVQGTPKAIPSQPVDASLEVLSATCIEVTFSSPCLPNEAQHLTHYVIDWDYVADFRNAEGNSSSCSSSRFGRCNQLFGFSSSPHTFAGICNLSDSETYYVRVAARNNVETQAIYPSGAPADNTNWSITLSAITGDQKPGTPLSISTYILGRYDLRVLFDAPLRNGGQAITDYFIEWDVSDSFDSSSYVTVPEASMDRLDASGSYVYDFDNGTQQLNSVVPYYVRIAAINSVGRGETITSAQIYTSSAPDAPSMGHLSTLSLSPLPITEATVVWEEPLDDGGDSIQNYIVEVWTAAKLPEMQVVKVQYSSALMNTKFSLSFSSKPQLKKETAMLPWNAPADLVRRELLNLGWDVSDDKLILEDVEVTRSSLSNGFAWFITFGSNPGSSINDGNQPTLGATVSANSDTGYPTISVTTIEEGQRSQGQAEIQFLQVSGTGLLTGYYRLKFEGSDFSNHIPANASALDIKMALELLSTVGEIDVNQNDSIDQSEIGTSVNLIHHYAITFLTNVGNVDSIVVNQGTVKTSNGDASVDIYDGDNEIDPNGVLNYSTVPGEQPVDYFMSELLEFSARSYTVTGLISGKEYFFAVSASNAAFGFGKRMTPLPISVIPPKQTPEPPENVTLSVNRGHNDRIEISFDPPNSDGGDSILRYRVELDHTTLFNNPIVQYFNCPSNSKRTIWEIKTATDGSDVIDGGSFQLKLEYSGIDQESSEIPYNAVALRWDEVKKEEELAITSFVTTQGSTLLSTSSNINLEGIIFNGDRLRFSGQSSTSKLFEVASVSGSIATLNEGFDGSDGVQTSTWRNYGGRGDPSSSRVHCQFDPNLCTTAVEARSGSMESKLEDLSYVISNGVQVEREGPDSFNGFTWRITFLDDSPPESNDFDLTIASKSLTTAGNTGSPTITATLIASGETYTSCTGTIPVPSYGGLVQGLEYYGRVSAVNALGYSKPMNAPHPQAPMVPPGPPTGVALDVVSASELRVMFGPPSDSGGSKITEYRIEWDSKSDFSDPQTDYINYLAGGAPIFKVISHLTAGIHYFARVSAKNSQGYGITQTTAPLSLNPHQKSSPPATATVGVTSDTMITVGWDAPLNDGGDKVTMYRLEWDTSTGFISNSSPPDKGFIDLNASLHSSYTIELLSPGRIYYTRVFAINSAGPSISRLSSPLSASPQKQVPGTPHTLVASSGSASRSLSASWQRPIVPHHGIACSGSVITPLECPTKYGGSVPSSNGGESIIEYEVEFNENSDFNGSDGGRQTVVGTSCTLLNLTPSRLYYVRVLARNAIGSGSYSQEISAIAAS